MKTVSFISGVIVFFNVFLTSAFAQTQTSLEQLAQSGLSIIDPVTLQTLYTGQNNQFVYQISGDTGQNWWYVKTDKWFLVQNEKTDFSTYEQLKTNLATFPIPNSNEFLFKVLVLQPDGTAAKPASANHAPEVTINSKPQIINDDSGSVIIGLTIKDEDKNNTSLNTEFSLGPDFSSWQKATIIMVIDDKIDININNNAPFPVGDGLNIPTKNGPQNLFLIWDSQKNLPLNYQGQIKIRLIAFDGLTISQPVETENIIFSNTQKPTSTVQIPASDTKPALTEPVSSEKSPTSSESGNNKAADNTSNNQSENKLKSLFKFCQQTDFPDVSADHWAYGFIDKLHSLCFNDQPIIRGYPDGLFRPERAISRFEFLKIALIGNGISLKTEFTNEEKFYDVSDEEPPIVYQVVYSAKELNIVEGYDDGNFYPYRPITRAEAATVLLKASQFDKTIPFNEFTELPWYSAYVYQIVKLDIMTGYENGYFGLENNLLRSEAAKIIYKTMLKKEINF